MVAALIIPRSATTHIRLIPKRARRLSTTGSNALTSVALPGQVCEQIASSGLVSNDKQLRAIVADTTPMVPLLILRARGQETLLINVVMLSASILRKLSATQPPVPPSS